MNPELEFVAEDYLVEQIEIAGGWAPKLVLKHGRGFPDRTIFLNGTTYLVEVKREKHGRRSEQQKDVHKHLNICGKHVYVLWGLAGVKHFLRLIAQECMYGLGPEQCATFDVYDEHFEQRSS